MPLLQEWEGRSVGDWRALWGLPRLDIHDVLGSTNDRAEALARDGVEPWTAVMAEHQTHGRGRAGKEWHSPEGLGLWVTLLVPSKGPDADALLPLRFGMAVSRLLDEWAPTGVGILLKWPNDLLLSRRKVGGILCETAGSEWVAVGLGLNILRGRSPFPSDLEEMAVSLEEGLGRSLSRGDLAGAVIGGIRKGITDGGPRLTQEELEEFAHRDALLGERVESEVEGRGVALGITPRGSLILKALGGSLREVRAGSVKLVS